MKKLWIILAIIIVLAAIGTGAWALWQANQPVKEETKQTDTSTQSNDQTSQLNSVTKPLTLYYVATEDNGIAGPMIGCGDSLVSRTTAPVTTTDIIKSSFEQLLSGKNQYIGQSGLYNALYQSDLTYASSTTAGDTVTVNLTGSLKLGGECDSPRVEAQLENTAKTAAGTTKAVINLNDKPLSESLSLN